MLEKIGNCFIIGCITAIAILTSPFSLPALAIGYCDKKAGHHLDRFFSWAAEKFGPIRE